MLSTVFFSAQGPYVDGVLGEVVCWRCHKIQEEINAVQAQGERGLEPASDFFPSQFTRKITWLLKASFGLEFCIFGNCMPGDGI